MDFAEKVAGEFFSASLDADGFAFDKAILGDLKTRLVFMIRRHLPELGETAKAVAESAVAAERERCARACEEIEQDHAARASRLGRMDCHGAALRETERSDSARSCAAACRRADILPPRGPGEREG